MVHEMRENVPMDVEMDYGYHLEHGKAAYGVDGAPDDGHEQKRVA